MALPLGIVLILGGCIADHFGASPVWISILIVAGVFCLIGWRLSPPKKEPAKSDAWFSMLLYDIEKDREFRLRGSTIRVGRTPDCDLVTDNRIIDTNQAVIICDCRKDDNMYRYRWTIEDMESANGTYVNGRRLQKGEKAVLRPGDTISFAKRWSFEIRDFGYPGSPSEQLNQKDITFEALKSPENQGATQELHAGTTPGSKSVALHFDENGKATDKEHASKVIIQELDEHGNMMQETFARLGPQIISKQEYNQIMLRTGSVNNVQFKLKSDDLPCDRFAILLYDVENERQIRLIGSNIRVGRMPKCDLLSSNQYISQNHALISFDGAKWTVWDPGSKNGTYLNGKRLGAGESVPLKPGDRISFAMQWTFEFRGSEQPVGDSTAANVQHCADIHAAEIHGEHGDQATEQAGKPEHTPEKSDQTAQILHKSYCASNPDRLERTDSLDAERIMEDPVEDISLIAEMERMEVGLWQQYDIRLAKKARYYFWEKDAIMNWAQYMADGDLKPINTLSAIGLSEKTEFITQYRESGEQIAEISELAEGKWYSLSVGGNSKTLQSPVKIVWIHLSESFQILSLDDDELQMRKYAETVIRRAFGTEQIKLVKEVPPECVSLTKKYGVVHILPFRLVDFVEATKGLYDLSSYDYEHKYVPWMWTSDGCISILYEGELTGYREIVDRGLCDYNNCFGMTFGSDDYPEFALSIPEVSRIHIPATVSCIKPNAFRGFTNAVIEVPWETTIYEGAFEKGVDVVRYSRSKELPSNNLDEPSMKELKTLDITSLCGTWGKNISKWLYTHERSDRIEIENNTLFYECVGYSFSQCLDYIENVIVPDELSVYSADSATMGVRPVLSHYIGFRKTGRFCQIVIDEGYFNTLSFFIRNTDGAEVWADMFITELVRALGRK